jgi:hypothetical protein
VDVGAGVELVEQAVKSARCFDGIGKCDVGDGDVGRTQDEEGVAGLDSGEWVAWFQSKGGSRGGVMDGHLAGAAGGSNVRVAVGEFDSEDLFDGLARDGAVTEDQGARRAEVNDCGFEAEACGAAIEDEVDPVSQLADDVLGAGCGDAG